MIRRALSRRGRDARALAVAAAIGIFGAVVPAAAQGELKIAVAAPMTGTSAAFGQNAQRGAEMAVEEINAAGGIDGKTVVFDIFDDRGVPREAASVAQSIAASADEYFAVLGHINSSATLAGMPIYSEIGIPVINASSSNPTITEQGWDNFIRMTIRGDYGAQQYSAFAINNLGKRRLGIVFVNNDFGRALRDDMMRAVEVLPGEVVAEAGFTPGVDKDFAAVITQFKNAGVDAVMLNTEYTEGGLFVGQSQNLGLTEVSFVGPDTLLYDSYLDLSQGGAEGTHILAAYDPYAASEATRSFMTRFQERYDTLPSQVAVFTYDLFHLLKQAIEEEGATKETLIDTIKGMTFEGAGGRYAWDEKGDVKDRTFAVIRVDNGDFVSTGTMVDESGLAVLR